MDIRSKWIKAQLLKKNETLRKFIPYTARMTERSLRTMLDRYGTVFVKPDLGAFGRGVMKISMRGRASAAAGGWRPYRCHAGFDVRTFSSFAQLYAHLRKRIGKETYVVQPAINLLRWEGKPADFRVVVQKNKQKRWEVTGIIARIARPGKIVTNGSSGGTVLPVEKLLNAYYKPKEIRLLLDRFQHIARTTARQLSKTHPRLFELGLDLAVSFKRNVWILEVNTRPDPVPFMKLKNKSMLRKIVRYGRLYGRHYRLKPKYPQKPV